MKQKKSVEDYLKAIYIISQKKRSTWRGHCRGAEGFPSDGFGCSESFGRGRLSVRG